MKHKQFIISFSILLFSAFYSNAQIESRLKVAVSGRFTVGAQMSRVENYGSVDWTTGPGVHLSLEPYLKLRWKNSFDLSFGTGLYFNNFNYYYDQNMYDVYYLAAKYETRFSKYFVLNNGPVDFLSIGCGVGVSPHTNETITRNTSAFTAVTTSYPVDPFYISPHIGTYRRDGRFGYSLSLQYTQYRSKDPYIKVDLSGANASATAEHKGSYIGLNLIVDYDLKINPKPIEVKFPFKAPNDSKEREVVTNNTLKIKKKRIRVIVWDHGMIDHDTVSILLNDHPVLFEYGLNHDKKKIKVRLENKENELTLYAHNEGSVKPNTAAVIIRVGWFRKYNYVLNSTLNSSESLKIIYDD